MDRSKNAYSFIMWIILTGLTLTLFINIALNEVQYYGLTDGLLSYVAVGLVILVIVIISLILTILCRKIIPAFSGSILILWSIIGFIIGIAVFITFRVLVFNGIIEKISSSTIINTYYSSCMVEKGIISSFDYTTVNGLYNGLVSIAFLLLGNSASGLYICEQIILLLSVIIIYQAIKVLAGGLEGFTYLCGVALIPAFVIHSDYYAVYFLEYLLFAIGLGLIALTIKFRHIVVLNYILVVLTAISIGWFSAYADINLALILLFVTVLIACKDSDLIYRIICPVIVCIFSIFSLLLTFCFDNVISLNIKGIYQDILTFVNYRLCGQFDVSKFILLSNETYLFYILIAVVVLLTAFWISNTDSSKLLITLLVCESLLLCFLPQINCTSSKLVVISLFAALGGSGINNLLGVRKVIIEDPVVEEVVEVTQAMDVPNDNEITLFEAPIPLPKRAEKRDVDYDFDVPDDLMHYDIDVFEIDSKEI